MNPESIATIGVWIAGLRQEAHPGMTELFRHAGESTKRVVAAVGDAAHGASGDAAETGGHRHTSHKDFGHIYLL
jgi:hypothetical protein